MSDFPIVTIKQGDTGPGYNVGIPEVDANGKLTGDLVDISSANYTAIIAVPTAVPAISRAVTVKSADGFRFLARLTPAETATIPVGSHMVAIQLSNTTTTPETNYEVHGSLIIDAELIP